MAVARQSRREHRQKMRPLAPSRDRVNLNRLTMRLQTFFRVLSYLISTSSRILKFGSMPGARRRRRLLASPALDTRFFFVAFAFVFSSGERRAALELSPDWDTKGSVQDNRGATGLLGEVGDGDSSPVRPSAIASDDVAEGVGMLTCSLFSSGGN